MTDAVYYDGKSARRRAVSLEVGEAGLKLQEDGRPLAVWPAAGIRRKDSPDGLLRLALEGGPELARLDIADPRPRRPSLLIAATLRPRSGSR